MNIDNFTLFVENGGDGSANITLCTDPKLADILDDAQEEGYGEPSTMRLKQLIDEALSPESCFIQYLIDERDELTCKVYETFFVGKTFTFTDFEKEFTHRVKFKVNGQPVKVLCLNQDWFNEDNLLRLIKEFKEQYDYE